MLVITRLWNSLGAKSALCCPLPKPSCILICVLAGNPVRAACVQCMPLPAHFCCEDVAGSRLLRLWVANLGAAARHAAGVVVPHGRRERARRRAHRRTRARHRRRGEHPAGECSMVAGEVLSLWCHACRCHEAFHLPYACSGCCILPACCRANTCMSAWRLHRTA